MSVGTAFFVGYVCGALVIAVSVWLEVRGSTPDCECKKHPWKFVWHSGD